MSKSTYSRNNQGKRPARPAPAGSRRAGRSGPHTADEGEGAGPRGGGRPRPQAGPKRSGSGRPSSGRPDNRRGSYKPSGDGEDAGSRGGRPRPQAGPRHSGSGRPSSSRRGPNKPFGDGEEAGSRGGRPRPQAGPRHSGSGRPSSRRGPNKPFGDGEEAGSGGRPRPQAGPRHSGSGRPSSNRRGPNKPFDDGEEAGSRGGRPRPYAGPKRSGSGRAPGSRPGRPSGGAPSYRPQGGLTDRRHWKEDDPGVRRPFRRGERSSRFSLPNPANDGLIRLNKYLAQAGVGSRREADEFIAAGTVKVNGEVVTELGAKVHPGDTVHFGGQKLSIEQKRYVLLNKPKDTLTTTDDPRERHTVMDLVAKACTERLYPVGRLDRNTTGVLLLTNDGELAKKLTHPSHGAEKLYHATLDRNLTVEELQQLVEGVMLDDGPAQADEASFVGSSRREVGLLIHMGRNRVVRRMFSALGAEVVKLDRVMFAGLTKKDLGRGRWRHLEEKEVVWLKQMKGSSVRKPRRQG